MAAFEIYRDRAGGYRWRLIACDGEVTATSDWCNSKTLARKGIESLRMNAATAILDDQTESASVEPRLEHSDLAPGTI